MNTKLPSLEWNAPFIFSRHESLEGAAERQCVNAWNREKIEKYRAEALQPGEGLPLFRKRFQCQDGLRRCTVYATALGIFDLYCNGTRVGDLQQDGSFQYDELKPGWTDCEKRTLYYAYDMTVLLSKGQNVLLAAVSPGWWMGRISMNTYGTHVTAFSASIVIEYTDGSQETVVTDAGWASSLGGPVRSADIWDGEFCDASQPDYTMLSLTDFDDSGWDSASIFSEFTGEVTPHIGPTVRVREHLSRRPESAVIHRGIIDNGSDYGEIHVIRTLEDTPACTLAAGESVVYDLGQNMVGRPKLTLRGDRGTAVTLRFAEMKNDSGDSSRGNDGPKGSIYTANYRSAKSSGVYVCRGGDPETWAPLFTFYGFRYIEITAAEAIEITDLRAEVLGSDIRETGGIETSDELVNRLFCNIFWGQRGNYLSIPTDCPQRDERLGWTGDTQIFIGAASYNADVLGFFRKWLQDVRDSQRSDGAYTDVVPRSRVVGAGNAAWGDAGLIVPYTLYRMYGDRSILAECYDSMEKYMGFLRRNGGPDCAYGDWLAFEPTDGRYISKSFYVFDTYLMSKIAGFIGKNDRAAEYAALHETLREEFCRDFLDAGGLPTEKSQTACLLALKFDLLPARSVDPVKRLLTENIRKNGNKLSTGFIGTGILMQTLSLYGEDETAYTLLQQTGCPSWLYSILQGATTVWERWNSYTLESGFGDVGMNSFNHYAYGAVAEWMYRYMAGIEADESAPGFGHIILQPRPDMRTPASLPQGQQNITWVRAWYDSAAGRIESAWRFENGIFSYEASVPVPATLRLPLAASDASTVELNGTEYPVDTYPNENGALVMQLAPGRYTIRLGL